MAEQKLTHINAKGEAHMVDVSPKDETKRTAVAEGFIFMKPETLALIESGKAKCTCCRTHCWHYGGEKDQ